MQFLRTTNGSIYAAVLPMMVLAFFLQQHFLVNWDVSWDLLAASRLLAGGSYTRDFFDLNPPLIFYILIPPVWLGEYFHHPALLLRLYVFGLSLCSLFLCQRLIRSTRSLQSPALTFFLTLMLAFVLFLLPGTQIGQREQLLVIFTLPYYFLVHLRLQEERPSVHLAAGIGLFSALGFALKPHFLAAFLLVEAYVAVHQRSLRAAARMEVFVITAFCSVYVLFIAFRHPDYLYKVIPMSAAFYYSGFGMRWYQMFLLDCIPYALLMLVWFLFSDRKAPTRALQAIFACALTGNLLVYFSQMTNWSYHALPAFSCALILGVLLVEQWWNQRSSQSVFPVAALLALLAITPLMYTLEDNFRGRAFKESQRDLLVFMQSLKKRESVYCMTASPRFAFPSVAMSEAHYASRLLHLYWVPGAVNKLRDKGGLSLREQHIEQAFISMVTEDISSGKPDYILIDTWRHHTGFMSGTFDYLAYFQKDTTFAALFKSYVQTGILEDTRMKSYQYTVFKRRDKAAFSA